MACLALLAAGAVGLAAPCPAAGQRPVQVRLETEPEGQRVSLTRRYDPSARARRCVAPCELRLDLPGVYRLRLERATRPGLPVAPTPEAAVWALVGEIEAVDLRSDRVLGVGTALPVEVVAAGASLVVLAVVALTGTLALSAALGGDATVETSTVEAIFGGGLALAGVLLVSGSIVLATVQPRVVIDPARSR